MIATVFLIAAAQLAAGQTLAVRHDHSPGGGCEGSLHISAEGIRYQTSEGDHSRDWSWAGIQTLDIFSPTRFIVLTYEDQKWRLGRDRPFDFTVTGGDGLDTELIRDLTERVSKPVTVRTPPDLPADYEVAVKHLHRLGGCQGRLRFGSDWVSYRTDHAEDRRYWRLDRDLAAIWSQHPFELQLQVYERDADLGATRMFRFQLKEALDREYYEKLRRVLVPVR